jgi:hypothetical protein
VQFAVVPVTVHDAPATEGDISTSYVTPLVADALQLNPIELEVVPLTVRADGGLGGEEGFGFGVAVAVAAEEFVPPDDATTENVYCCP